MNARQVAVQARTGLNDIDSPNLLLTGISKRYGATVVLRDIELDIPHGALMCLLGPSGCGKTTLLRILAGLEHADCGRVLMGGRDISAVPAQQRRFGFVFQSYALFPNLNVSDNIAFGMQGGDRRRRVRQLLELTHLQACERKFPSQLSGGQQQRVALARALALSPSVLLLDEPFSALDTAVRTHLRAELKTLHERMKLSTILVTHDREEAMSLAERIVVMADGRVLQVGRPRELYEAPIDPFVAAFMGEANLLPYTRLANGRIALHGWAGSLPDVIGERIDDAGGLLMCRPEHLRITDSQDSAAVQTKGCVTAVEYLGAEARVSVHASGDQRVIVRQRTDAGPAPMVSDIVPLSLDPTRCRLFPKAS